MSTTISKEQVIKLANQFTDSEKNTGDVRVQIAIMTDRIKKLTEHFSTHKKDNHSKRGLFQLIGKRRSLLSYLKKKDLNEYRSLIKELGLRS